MSSTSPRSRRASSYGRSKQTAFMVDLFKRIPREYQSASYLGGILSATCACVLTCLILLELQAYLTVSYQSAVVFPGSTVANGLTTPYQPYVSIRFNVTFPHLPCEYLSSELFDVYGRHSITNSTPDKKVGDVGEEKVSMRIFKWRVTDEGKKRASVMQEHVEASDDSEPIHEELPYHHAAHQYRDVVPLTSKTFDTFIESKDVVMVDFYAPWCIWCQRLAPVWENFAHTVGEKDYSDFVGVAKVDCTQEQAICQRRRIAGYPSIFLYRDRNPHSHTAYQGDRTTTAFIEFIEGLGVETDHRKEVEDLKDDIQGELNAEANVIKKAAFKERDERIDGSLNHPLKSLTAPGGVLGTDGKESSLTGIMRALDQAGGSRGAAFRIKNSNGGGSIQIISVRRIPTKHDWYSKKDKNTLKEKPLEFHTAQMKKEMNKDPNNLPVENGQESITIKVLPRARDHSNKDMKEQVIKANKVMKSVMTGKPLVDDEATVPQPVIATKQKDNKDDDNDATDTITENIKEIIAVKKIEEINEKSAEIKKQMKTGGRRLLAVEGDEENNENNGEQNGDDNESGRIADSALESLAELYKTTTKLEKKKKLWNEVVKPLPKDQTNKFTKLVGGSPFSNGDGVDKEPVLTPDAAKTKVPLSKQKPEPGAKDDIHHVSNTEGCLVYGAIVTEKVPATIRFQAKSKWHNFVSHHLDMTHVVHDFTFGDLTHKLQEEFAHIKFHEFEGTKMMTSLAPKEYKSESIKQTHHHYMRVVGTHVSLLGMAASETNKQAGGGGIDQLFQYTATSQQYHDTDDLPSAKFTFDFDPMLLTLREDAVPLHKFGTSLMAIVGGVMVVFTMLNSLLSNMLLMVGKSK